MMEVEKKTDIISEEEISLDSIDHYKTKKIKKKIVRIISILLLLVIIMVFPVFFYKQELNRNVMIPEYKKGGYHFHSTFSDGSGKLETILSAAKAIKLDFVIMTDHGRPNVKCSQSTRWYDGLLHIGGSEFSLKSGHLAAVGYGFDKNPEYKFPEEPQEAIDDINRNKGISFLAHPHDGKIPWTAWDVKAFTGIEILNGYSSAMKSSIIAKLKFPFQYLFNKRAAILNTVDYPVKNLGTWDNYNQKGKYFSIFALDTHAKIPITKSIFFKMPSYKTMFKIFTVYVRTDAYFSDNAVASSRIIIDAMKRGNYFNVIEAIAPANGFDFFYTDSKEKRYEMGSTVDDGKGSLHLLTPFEFKTDIHIKKDGKIFKRIDGNRKKRLTVPVTAPGVYRVELFIPGNKFDELPWILTNPVFIGNRPQPDDTSSDLKPVSLNIPLSGFNVEKNERSKSRISFIKDEGQSFLRLNYTLKSESNSNGFWVALADRKARMLNHGSGIEIQCKSDRYRRFIVEVRIPNPGKESISLRRSFLASPGFNRIQIPFARMYQGNKRGENVTITRISSLFIMADDSIGYPGNSGQLTIKSVGIF